MKDGDVDALYQTIDSVYDKTIDYQELSIQGYMNVMKDFNMVTIARKVEDTYQSLLAEPMNPTNGWLIS